VKRIKLFKIARIGNMIGQLDREIRFMRMLSHPNALRLIEVLHARAVDELYLVLEYADRGSLGAVIERGERLSHCAVFSVLKQFVGVVKYLHDAGYVHQDIKPCNILLDSSGRAVLGDIGIGHSLESAGMVVETPAYQAPEALDDSCGSDELSEPALTQKEDIWALGVTLYQLLFMRLPFVGGSLYEIVNHIRESPLVIPDGTDPAIAKLLRGMLTIDPMNRYGIDDLVAHPLIRDAADRAPDLPDLPLPPDPDGDVVELACEPVVEGCLISDLAMSLTRRPTYPLRRVRQALAKRAALLELNEFPREKDWTNRRSSSLRLPSRGKKTKVLP
jgi:serine/threonine protein kinase